MFFIWGISESRLSLRKHQLVVITITDLVPTLKSINVLVSIWLEHQTVLQTAVSQDELRELEIFSFWFLKIILEIFSQVSFAGWIDCWLDEVINQEIARRNQQNENTKTVYWQKCSGLKTPTSSSELWTYPRGCVSDSRGHCLTLIRPGGRDWRHQVDSIEKALALVVAGLQTFLLLFKAGTFQHKFMDLFSELKQKRGLETNCFILQGRKPLTRIVCSLLYRFIKIESWLVNS